MGVRQVVAVLLATGLATGPCAPGVGAQSAQPWSVQPSFLVTGQDLNEQIVPGVGFEGQFRYTPRSLWSLGMGVQYSTHSSGGETMDILGAFVEPRYALDIGSDRVAPYLAARLALLRESATLAQVGDVSSTGSGFGAGAGLLFRLTPTVNVDVGAALVSQGFSDTEGPAGEVVQFSRFLGYVAKAGFSWGFGAP